MKKNFFSVTSSIEVANDQGVSNYNMLGQDKIGLIKNGKKFPLVKKHYKKYYWTKDEDKILLTQTKKSGRNKWKEISKCFVDKSPSECQLRYLKINPSIKKGRWNPLEDKQLFSLIDEYGFSWTFISKFFKNRNPKQIRSRYINNLSKRIVDKMPDTLQVNPEASNNSNLYKVNNTFEDNKNDKSIKQNSDTNSDESIQIFDIDHSSTEAKSMYVFFY